MSGKRERIGVVAPGAYLDTVTVLCETIEALAGSGYAVDVFTHTGPDFVPPHFRNPKISIRVLDTLPAVSDGHVRKSVGRLLSERLRARRLVASVERLHTEYLAFIGVDVEGLSLAASLVGDSDIPLVYHSLELLLSAELQSEDERRMKEEELALSRRAAFIVIQDEERAALMSRDNDISLDRFVLLPNAPAGPARRCPSDYWRRRFSLSPDTRVLLHSGSLWGWTGIDDIVAAAGELPDRWVLVVHSRSDAGSLPRIDRLRALAAPGKVLFSLKPVPRNELDELADGADAGLAFYVPTPGSRFTQTNIESIGLSSGKIAQYLRAGLPVIVNSTPTIARVVEERGFGVSVSDAAGIPGALERIEGGYNGYSSRAVDFFNERLDFRLGFQRLLGRLRLLEGQSMVTKE